MIHSKIPEISIIVPVYKVEPYLRSCVDSILQQSFTDFELILVDDGSPDRCPEICDEYARQDERVRVIHKENGGLSSARNAGIDAARGHYIGFIDSDDYIHRDMFRVLRQHLTDSDADIAVCGVVDRYPDHDKYYTGPPVSGTFSPEEALKIMLVGDVVRVYAVNKLYKRSIFEELRYPVGKTMEDGYLIVEVTRRASRIYIDSTPYYYYIHRADSITTGSFTEHDFNIIGAYEYSLRLITEHFPRIHPYALRRLMWANGYLLTRLCSEPKQVRRQYKKQTRAIRGFFIRNMVQVFKVPELPLKNRLSYLLIAASPSLFMKMKAKRLDNVQ